MQRWVNLRAISKNGGSCRPGAWRISPMTALPTCSTILSDLAAVLHAELHRDRIFANTLFRHNGGLPTALGRRGRPHWADNLADAGQPLPGLRWHPLLSLPPHSCFSSFSQSEVSDQAPNIRFLHRPYPTPMVERLRGSLSAPTTFQAILENCFFLPPPHCS